VKLGTVTVDLEARVDIVVGGASGAQITIQAILDTGFSEYLTLPITLIEELNLPLREATQIRLADGSLRIVDVYEGRVRWFDGWRAVLIQASGGVRDHQLTIDVVESGDVVVENLV
jgi:predicted aspartyl protease